jgi:putative ABC transport system permease protein
MFRNYLKIAFRTLWKHKGYSFINVAGLALGMACALFILLWVQDELSFDRFHANAKTLYRVEQDQNGGQGKFHVNVTPYGMRDALKTEIPEIQDAARSARAGTFLVRQGEKAFFENRVAAVDPSFLKMFSFPVVQGDVKTALSGAGSMVLTKDLAKKYFGTDNPIGRTVTLNNKYPVTVSAVLKKIPSNSNLQFDALLPVEFLKNLGVDLGNWGNNSIITYVQLHEKSAASAVNAKITRLVRDRTLASWRGNEENWKKIQADPEQLKRYNSYVGPDFMLMPVVDLRLYGYFGFDRSNQAIKTITTFAAIGLFVLLIACINFMNLATARSANRAREVGLRKVVGAYRRSIAGQFYGESVLTAVLAGLASFVLVVILLPAFNAVAGKTMTIASLLSLKFGLGILAVTALTGIVAGSYPALILSAFQPIKVLKGRTADGARGASLRKVLVVIQFGLSVLLLIGMAVAARQIDYMRNKKLGYDKEQLIYLPLRGETGKNYAALKERILRNPKIQGVTGTAQQPTAIGSNSWGATWDGLDPNQRYLIGCEFVDYDYPETMKIGMAAGRSFSRKHSTDETKAFLVNEAVPKLMGLDAAAAVGKRFNFMGIDGTIVGVMKDFHYQSVRASIEPLAVAMGVKNPAGTWVSISFAVVRLKAGDIPGSLGAVEAVWRTVNPGYPFEYRFFDQDFDQMYRGDEQMGTILKIFATLAMAIACLGLFGLASFTAEQRTKEIGVRKVLGASAPGIVVLLSKEFAKWVLIANALAWPAAYLLMRNWLQGFAYKTEIAWWLFLVSGAGAMIVALLTVSLQALRAAQTNPVKALKYE